MSKKNPDYHLDIFKKEIRPGNFVVTNWWNSDLQVCVVTKLSPKMVQIKRLNNSSSRSHTLKSKYPNEMLVVKDEDVTLYVLGNSN